MLLAKKRPVTCFEVGSGCHVDRGGGALGRRFHERAQERDEHLLDAPRVLGSEGSADHAGMERIGGDGRCRASAGLPRAFCHTRLGPRPGRYGQLGLPWRCSRLCRRKSEEMAFCPAMGTNPLNLWVFPKNGRKPCGQGVLRTPHQPTNHGVYSRLRHRCRSADGRRRNRTSDGAYPPGAGRRSRWLVHDPGARCRPQFHRRLRCDSNLWKREP